MHSSFGFGGCSILDIPVPRFGILHVVDQLLVCISLYVYLLHSED